MAVNLGDVQTTAACPQCGYEVFLLVSEVAAQTYVRCDCCRVLIRLIDQDASTHTAARDIDKALREASDAFGRAFRKELR
jgi:predicted  nucleic acid-binding Zn-ribbon protein